MNEIRTTGRFSSKTSSSLRPWRGIGPWLRNFIRKYVADTSEAEDILQDVFYELLEAYRFMKPIEHVTAWLFRVARNRMTDLFRKNKPTSLNNPVSAEEGGETLEDLLPSAEDGPEAAYARNLLLDALDEALEEYLQLSARSSSPTS